MIDTRSALCALALTPLAHAQGLADAYVSDTSADTIWFCSDLDQNGDYLAPLEVVPFYDDTIGAVAMTNNAGLIRSDDGVLWVTDTSEDHVLRLEDLDGDGTAHGAGEATKWFDGTAGGNASGVELTSGRGMWRDADGVFWVASANTGGGGNDAILRLEDMNGDGDANDLGEAIEFYVVAPGASVGDSIPTVVVRGADGHIYYCENGVVGNPARGVYRLEDLNGSGMIDGPGEVTAFFIPPAQGGTAFHWELTVLDTGEFLLGDSGNELFWTFSDADMSGTVDPATEAQIAWMNATSSNIWDVSPAADGSLYTVEDQSPDRLLRFDDANGDGIYDPATEVTVIFDDTMVTTTTIVSPKAIAVVRGSGTLGVAYCGPAPPNSSGGSAEIHALGSDVLADDDLRLECVGMPQNAFGFFLTSQMQGFTANPGGSDGNLCLGGSIGRFVMQIGNSGSAGTIGATVDLSAVPQPNGLVPAQVGETWNFQCWFRDANPAVTSNLSDGVSVQLR